MSAPNLYTERLLLRQWRENDLPLFAKLNGDEEVMEYFPSTLTQEESDALADRIQRELNEEPYGLWAVEIKGGAPFIGFVGLHRPEFEAHFTPCLEIGWRLAKEHWNKGYATEAACRVLDYAFNTLHLPELVSLTTTSNTRSQKVMKKLGMERDPKDDFEHPRVPEGSPLRPHVLYRIRNDKK